MALDTCRLARRLLLAALVVQVLFAASRIPGSVYGKRLRKLAAWQERGGLAWHGRRQPRALVEEVAWLRENTPADAVILFEHAAEHRWPHQFNLAFAYLTPRLLLRADQVEDWTQPVAGRTPARGRPPGRGEGYLILAPGPERLRLEVR